MRSARGATVILPVVPIVAQLRQHRLNHVDTHGFDRVQRVRFAEHLVGRRFVEVDQRFVEIGPDRVQRARRLRRFSQHLHRRDKSPAAAVIDVCNSATPG